MMTFSLRIRGGKMKKVLAVLLAAVLLAAVAHAGERILFGGQVEHGGFGGPYVKFTQINNQFGLLVGGRGAWIINHVLAIGGGGCGLANNVDSNRPDSLVSFGYGGGILEWIIRSDEVLHFTIETLIGGGGIGLFPDNQQDSGSRDQHSDGVFVMEAAANLELNVATWFRADAGLGYRLVSGVEIAGLTNSDFSGPAATLMLKFGKF
jgi:opacity protein-like surface antigen